VAALLPADWETRFLRIDPERTVAGSADALLRDAPPTFALVGHSLGGIVAQQMAVLAPDRVTTMVLLGTSPLAPDADQRAAWRSLEGLVMAGRFGEIADMQPSALLPHHRADDAPLGRRVREMAYAVGPDRLRRQLAMQRSRDDLRPALAELLPRVLILCGTADQVCPPGRQQELARVLPHGTLVELPGVGHLAPLESPSSVAESLLAWLRLPTRRTTS
jgi:pimeloyl-ACP methyl ester carboxylesterase